MLAVSVIVPVYNLEEYLHYCVDSLLNQTFQDFELILVDDGSKDRSGIICDQYAEKDPRVHVIHQENKGVSKARNNGVKASSGDYITFIDGDDWVSKDYLETMHSLCRQYNADMSICGIERVTTYSFTNSNVSSGNLIISTGREALIRNGKIRGLQFRGPVIKLVKSDIIRSFPFPEDRTYSEDIATVYLWMNACEQVAETNAKLYFYFQRNGSLVRSGIDERRLAIIKTYNEMLSFFMENDYPELFSEILCMYLLELANYYEICIAENKRDLANSFQKELQISVEKWMDYKSDSLIEQREDILNIFISKNVDEYLKVYKSMLIRALTSQTADNQLDQLLNARKRLRKLIYQLRLKFIEYPLAYNVAFPNLMKIYWNAKGINNKLKSLLNR